MRKSNREVKDINQILDVIERCNRCILALNSDDNYPYLVPQNYGYKYEDSKLSLYLHGALEGKKHDLIKLNNRASFEMDTSHEIFSDRDRGYCTFHYESVIGRGRIKYIEEFEEKLVALQIIVDKYHRGEEKFEFSKNAMDRTRVFKLEVEEFTCKVYE